MYAIRIADPPANVRIPTFSNTFIRKIAPAIELHIKETIAAVLAQWRGVRPWGSQTVFCCNSY